MLRLARRLAQEQHGPLFVGPACAVALDGSLSLFPLRLSIITRSLAEIEVLHSSKKINVGGFEMYEVPYERGRREALKRRWS